MSTFDDTLSGAVPTERKAPYGATILWPGDTLLNGEVVPDLQSGCPEWIRDSIVAKAIAYANLEADNKGYLKRNNPQAPCWFSDTENGLVVQTFGSDLSPEVSDANIGFEMLGFLENSASCGFIEGCPLEDVAAIPRIIRSARRSLERVLSLRDPALISVRYRRLEKGRRFPYPYDWCPEGDEQGYMVIAEFPDSNEPGALMIPSLHLQSGTLQEAIDDLGADYSPYRSHNEDCHGMIYIIEVYGDKEDVLGLIEFLQLHYLDVDAECLGVDWLLDLALMYREKKEA